MRVAGFIGFVATLLMLVGMVGGIFISVSLTMTQVGEAMNTFMARIIFASLSTLKGCDGIDALFYKDC